MEPQRPPAGQLSRGIRRLDWPSCPVNGCRAWIRTRNNGFKVRCVTVTPLGNVMPFYHDRRAGEYSPPGRPVIAHQVSKE